MRRGKNGQILFNAHLYMQRRRWRFCSKAPILIWKPYSLVMEGQMIAMDTPMDTTTIATDTVCIWMVTQTVQKLKCASVVVRARPFSTSRVATAVDTCAVSPASDCAAIAANHTATTAVYWGERRHAWKIIIEMWLYGNVSLPFFLYSAAMRVKSELCASTAFQSTPNNYHLAI